jgi:hypothetical protein
VARCVGKLLDSFLLIKVEERQNENIVPFIISFFGVILRTPIWIVSIIATSIHRSVGIVRDTFGHRWTRPFHAGSFCGDLRKPECPLISGQAETGNCNDHMSKTAFLFRWIFHYRIDFFLFRDLIYNNYIYRKHLWAILYKSYSLSMFLDVSIFNWASFPFPNTSFVVWKKFWWPAAGDPFGTVTWTKQN